MITIVQDQVNDKCVALSMRTTKLTGNVLAKAMQAFYKKATSPSQKHGKQSVKSLAKQGGSLESVEISGDNIGSFKKVARKYNIDFALQKDNSQAPPNWVVFFKAKDSKALESAFKEFSRNVLKQKSIKTPILDKLNKFKEKVAAIASPAKTKEKGEISI